MDGSFSGKVVTVVGAGEGIGRSLSLALAREGARLHLADIDRARVEAAAMEASGLGASATPHVLDCSDAAAMEALAEAVFAAEGRVDLLFNVAGVVGGGPVESVPLALWRRVLDVNLWGVIHGVHAFAPRMIAAGRGGHVVNFASMAGLVAMPMVAPYSASKFAVVGLSESLAPELAAHGIRVTCVCPGMVRTGVIRHAALHLPAEWTGMIDRFVGRHGADPDRVAADVLAAVRRGRGLVVLAGGWMLPLWVVKRLSASLYQWMIRGFTLVALSRVERRAVTSPPGQAREAGRAGGVGPRSP